MKRRVLLEQARDLLQTVNADLNLKSKPCAEGCPHKLYEAWSDVQLEQTLSGMLQKLNRIIPSDVAQLDLKEET